MRYGIFSDIHSNLEALNAVIEAYKDEGIDVYLCCGDVVGYASNPKEDVALVRSISRITIAGNHDWASVKLFSVDYFNPVAKEAIFWTRRNLDDKSKVFLENLKLTFKNEHLTLVHGTLDNPRDFNYMTDGFIAWETFSLMETNVCFLGHTHISAVFIKDEEEHIHYREEAQIDIKDGNKYIINVGSVGQPRDGNPKACFCIYDTDKKKVEIKRVSYNIESTKKKIIDAGLPQSLGDRLIIGR